MSDYSSLKATINANVKANNDHEITGSIMNSVLNAMVNSLGAGYQFMGVATPTNPGSAQTPDYKCFYLATTPGTYTNLGGLVVADGEVALLKYDTSWTKEVTGIVSADKLSQLGQETFNAIGKILPESLSPISTTNNVILKPDGTTDSGVGIVKNYDVAGLGVVAITGRQGTPTSGYAIACAYDSNNVLLKAYTLEPSTNYNDYAITLPSNAKYLKVSTSNSTFQPNVDCKADLTPQMYLFSKTNASELPSNTNLNNINAFGIYYFTATTAQSLVNIPFVGGGYLIVERTTPANKNYCKQILIYGNGKTYSRYLSAVGTPISDWISIEVMSEIISDILGQLNNIPFNEISPIETVTGYKLNPNGTTDVSVEAAVNTYDITGKQYVAITGRQGTPATSYAIACAYDLSNNLLRAYVLTAGTTYIDYIIELPTNAKTLKVCTSNRIHQPTIGCKDTQSIEDVVNYILGVLENNSAVIPNYWDTLMQNKVSEINSKNYAIGGTGDNFVFITDIHEDYNNGKSPALISYVLKNTSVRNVVIGGDLYTSAASKAAGLAYLQGLKNKYNFTNRVFAIRGNHDSGNSITEGEYYSIFDRPLENFLDTLTPGDSYFYRDNVTQKIRYIFCDCPNYNAAMPTAQQTWLQNRITELETGWTVVIFAHAYWNAVSIGSTATICAYGTSLVNAIDAIVDNASATIAALIVGHTHADRNTTSAKGYPIISTTCDAGGSMASTYDSVTPNRTPGTTSEQAFDVYNIDTNARKIYITRIGGNGTDREFTY